MKKNYKALTKIMKKCTDHELLLYRTIIAMGVVTFETVDTGERTLSNNLEVFDMITMELVYREVL